MTHPPTRTPAYPHAWTDTARVLTLIREGEGVTRAQLGEQTGLARGTIAARLAHLKTQGLVLERSSGVSTGGRPPTLLSFNAGAGVVLAIDAGASRVTLAVADLCGEILTARTHRDAIAGDPEATVAGWCDGLEDLLTAGGFALADVRAVAVALPGQIDHANGRPANGLLMPGWCDFPVTAAIAGRFGCEVAVDSDANAIALGEARRDEAAQSLVVVKAGIGIGLGYVTAGVVQRGMQGAAGDIGHLRAPGHEDVPCRCGRRGCLEAVAGGAALRERLVAAGLPCAGTADVARLARDGVPEAIAAVSDAGRAIGFVLATVVNVLNPSRVVVAGDLSQAGGHLLPAIRETVYRESSTLATLDLEIAPSPAGVQAGLVGTITMAVELVLQTASAG